VKEEGEEEEAEEEGEEEASGEDGERIDEESLFEVTGEEEGGGKWKHGVVANEEKLSRAAEMDEGYGGQE